MIKIHTLLLNALLAIGSVAMYADDTCRPTKTNQAAHHAAKMTECTARIKEAEHKLNRAIHNNNMAVENLEKAKQNVRHAEHDVTKAKHDLAELERNHSTLPSY